VLQPARDAERQRRDDDLVVTSAPASALAHGIQQSGRRSGLVRDNENGCRLLIHELTSE
jgi:hypothetical protein